MTTEDLSLINEILPRLNSARADAYEDWLAVGMALFHAGADCGMWDAWSRQSDKYRPDACAQKWKGFNSASGSTLGIGSLVEWARADGFDPYAGKAFDWDDVISISGGDAANPVAKIFSNTDLIRYLQAVFKGTENVNYVVDAYERDGKFLPASKGVTRGVAGLVADLQKYDDISYAIGDYNKDAGAWIRVNPVREDGGSKNEDVVDFRHVLVESDSMDTKEQLATIRRLRLPCAAIVNSGGKSVHAIVKIDAGDDSKLYWKRVAFLFEVLGREKFLVDKQCKNPSRLSRMPGVWRGGRKQFLVGVNEGCVSWSEWEAEIKANDFEFCKLDFDELINTPLEDKSDNLLGNRFLTREGSWLIVAQSGVGKSVLAMQMAILLGVGRDFYGLKPVGPLKVAIVQAENNKLDLVEPMRSICDNLNLSAAEKKMLRTNFSVYPNSSECGSNFGRLLERIARDMKPDIVIVDPLLSYIGGDISKQDVCSAFLRNTVHPILQKHQMALIIMHHTGKPRGKDEEASGDALNYVGTGSSELTNYVRAASTIFRNKNDDRVFDFTYAKRGKRAECDSVIYLKQGENGNIFWDIADRPNEAVKAKTRKSKYDGQGWENMGPCSYDELMDKIKEVCGAAFDEDITDKKADNIRRVLLLKNTIILNKDSKTYQGALWWKD